MAESTERKKETKPAGKKKVPRIIPHNQEAEQAVLGAFLIDKDACLNFLPTLVENDFYSELHKRIFNAMKSLIEKPGVVIDLLTVTDYLETQGTPVGIDGIKYFNKLVDSIPSTANVSYYVEAIKRDSMLRSLIDVSDEIAQNAYVSADADSALQKAEQLVFGLSESQEKSDLTHVAYASGRAVADIERAQVGDVDSNVIKTGFPKFDALTKGFRPGQLIVLAARPSVGKTAFALNIAANVCLNYEKRVALFSLEMSEKELMTRMLANVAGISLNDAGRRNGLTEKEFKNLCEAHNKLTKCELYIDSYGFNTPQQILSKCRRLKREKGSLDLVIIDYLQLMETDERVESRQQQVSMMSRRLKLFAKELEVPILVLSQMSRAIESLQRKDGKAHEPVMSDLRESGAIEQDADIIVFLHKPGLVDKTITKDYVQLRIAKNRNGVQENVDTKWNGDKQTFIEYEFSENEMKIATDGEGESYEEDAIKNDSGLKTPEKESFPPQDTGATGAVISPEEAAMNAAKKDPTVGDLLNGVKGQKADEKKPEPKISSAEKAVKNTAEAKVAKTETVEEGQVVVDDGKTVTFGAPTAPDDGTMGF